VQRPRRRSVKRSRVGKKRRASRPRDARLNVRRPRDEQRHRRRSVKRPPVRKKRRASKLHDGKLNARRQRDWQRHRRQLHILGHSGSGCSLGAHVRAGHL
jgi:hypothetical protein